VQSPPNTYQAPVCQWLHVSRAPGLIGSREFGARAPRPLGPLTSFPWHWRRVELCTQHLSRLSRRILPSPGGSAGRRWKRARPHPSEKHVRSLMPSHSTERCRPTRTGARRPFVSGSGEGQRSGRAGWGPREWVGAREGVQSSAARCQVFVPMTPATSPSSPRRPIWGSGSGISFGLHPAWRELGDGLTLFPPSTSSRSRRGRKLACASA
jgi:hypothetical protein